MSPNVQYKLKHLARLRQEGCTVALVIDDYPSVIKAFGDVGVPGVLVASNGVGFTRG